MYGRKKTKRNISIRIPIEEVYKDYGFRPGERITFVRQKIFHARPVKAVVEKEYPYFITVRVFFRNRCNPGCTNSYITSISKVSLFLNEVTMRDGNGMLVI